MAETEPKTDGKAKGKTEPKTDGESVENLQKRIAELEAENATLTKKATAAAEETEEQKIDRMCSTLSKFINLDGKIRSGIELKDVVKVCQPIVKALIEAKDEKGQSRLPKHILPDTIKVILEK